MLSICIPVYNEDVRQLVQALYMQATNAGIVFEIRVADDASDEEFVLINNSIKNLPYVHIHNLQENVGRAKIRNFLISQSVYEYIVLIDCDAKVLHDSFMQQYVQAMGKALVVCGGTAYSIKAPPQYKKLRWNYGKMREQRPANLRNKNPYNSFSTFNFMAHASVWKTCPFYESIQHYGHEDTLWGFCLEENNISIHHINNALEHSGLDTNAEFLHKTRVATQTLMQLYTDSSIPPQFFANIRIIRLLEQIISYKLSWILQVAYTLFGRILAYCIIKLLPTVYLLDAYKILYINNLYRNYKNSKHEQ